MTAKRRLGTTGYYVVSILIAVVAMIPFLWMISTSLKSRGALMSIPIEWIPAEPSLDAYGEVFSRFPFLKTIGNSLFTRLVILNAKEQTPRRTTGESSIAFIFFTITEPEIQGRNRHDARFF